MNRFTLLEFACVMMSSGACAASLSSSVLANQPQGISISEAVHKAGRLSSRPVWSVAGPVRVQAAQDHALNDTQSGFSLGAVQIYAFNDRALYRLETAPGEVSDIVLQPGESLISVAAGDTSRWVVGDTASGSGSSRRAHVLVKPTGPGLATNLLIATDRRVYHLELKSLAHGAAMTSIAWTYADDPLLALKAQVAPPPEPSVAAGVAVEKLDFNYRIEGDNPSWRPVRAFDDGHQVFIEFPPSLGDGEAPPLFLIGSDGKAELVNYRLRGRYYVVDRLFAAAELRLGQKHQLVVRILRDRPGTRRRVS